MSAPIMAMGSVKVIAGFCKVSSKCILSRQTLCAAAPAPSFCNYRQLMPYHTINTRRRGVGASASLAWCLKSDVNCIQNALNKSKINHSYLKQCMTLRNSMKLTLPGMLHVNLYSTQSKESTTEEILLKSTSTQKQDDSKEKSKSDGKKANSWFSPKNAWKLGLLSLGSCMFLIGGTILVEWGAPMYDKDGVEMVDEFTGLPTWQQYPKRALQQVSFFTQSIQDPSSQKLLPDPLQEPYYQPPYTLVLEMNGVLVHPDWTLSTGWRFKKRPAVDYFLQQVAPPLFEVVIYTSEQGFTAWPILDSLDPNGVIMYRLFRDATRYTNGHHVKDLDCLNRDLSKVIIVDCDPDSFKLHTRNAIGMQKWKGNDDDRKLVDLAAFLRVIAASGVEDVRTVLDHYSQFDDPLEAFKENQRRLQEEQERKLKTDGTSGQPSLTKSWSSGIWGRKR